MTQTTTDMACVILQRTRDGDDLDPSHLWLVQEAVNYHLNEKGMAAFRKLYEEVAAGKYQKPWFHGIENLTRDHDGYILWKGKRVEHYSGNAYTEERKSAAEEVARRCRLLESKGIVPTTTTVIWKWDSSKEDGGY